MNSSTGKIARLPHAIRDELNRRLNDGEPGTALLRWLNNHPDVKAVLAAHFDGRPISHANLTAWKQGAFLVWQARRDLFDELQSTVGDTAKLAESCDSVINHVAALLSARYAAALAAWDGDPAGPAADRLRTLSFLSHDIAALQRSYGLSARLHIEKGRYLEECRAAEEERRQDAEFAERKKDPEYIRQRQEFVNRMMGRPLSTPLD